MERPTIFIGSSSEGLPTARAIKQQFEADADADVWNEEVFKLNSSYLESLQRAANLYDFAILVLTPDDAVKSRGKTRLAPRDNVVFEHGLFLGRLGLNRSFVVREESVEILSDFAGITVATYRKRDDGNLVAAVGTACNRIRDAITKHASRSEISLLPSTALAIGYHENFIKKVVSALTEGKGIKKKTTRTGADGKPEVLEEPLNYDSFSLRVIIPEMLVELDPNTLKMSVKNLVQIILATPYRDFPFYIRAKAPTPATAGSLELFDIPTTLLASRGAIDLLLHESTLGRSKDREKLEQREIRNFEKTLDLLIERDYGRDNPYVRSDRTSSLVL